MSTFVITTTLVTASFATYNAKGNGSINSRDASTRAARTRDATTPRAATTRAAARRRGASSDVRVRVNKGDFSLNNSSSNDSSSSNGSNDSTSNKCRSRILCYGGNSRGLCNRVCAPSGCSNGLPIIVLTRDCVLGKSSLSTCTRVFTRGNCTTCVFSF